MRITRTFALIVPLIISLVFLPSTFADHGQEVKLTLDYAHFLPVLIDENSNQTGQQVKVILNYTTTNSSVLNQIINAVMKVYTSNKTLVKTSSFPGGVVGKSSDSHNPGTTQ